MSAQKEDSTEMRSENKKDIKDSIHSLSSRGLSHSVNEDNHYEGNDFIVVVDGMGGESAGDVASKIVVESISCGIKDLDLSGKEDKEIEILMKSLIQNADEEIGRYVDANPESLGMGSTVLLAYHHGDRVYVSWCGDSRCLLYRQGIVTPLTKDHSLVQQLIDSGRITEEEAFSHPDNNIITRYAGGGKETCDPDFLRHDLDSEDLLIFCTDGLSGYCLNSEIAQCVDSHEESELPEALKSLALSKGSEDDITIVTMGRNFKGGSQNKIRKRKGWLASLFSR